MRSKKFIRTHRLTVRTHPFHGCNRDSNSLGFTNLCSVSSAVELCPYTAAVGGSIPSPSTKFMGLILYFFSCIEYNGSISGL